MVFQRIQDIILVYRCIIIILFYVYQYSHIKTFLYRTEMFVTMKYI